MPAAPLLGIDFGTSNSAAAILIDGEAVPVPLDGHRAIMPSAVFIGPDGFLCGQAAFDAYVANEEGRFMRGLKSLLGSPLLYQTTAAGGRRWRFLDIVARYLSIVKARAEAVAGIPLDRVMMGRPIRFDDRSDAADAQAEADLDAIVRSLGFTEVGFRFEPVAAAFDHEKTLDRETLTLVADIGGGTSDFTLQYLGGGSGEGTRPVLATAGVHIGGADYDRDISLHHAMPELGRGTSLAPGPMSGQVLPMPNAPFIDLATWHRIPFLYTREARAHHRSLLERATRPDLFSRFIDIVDEHRGHELAIAVESAKIDATAGSTTLDICGHAKRPLDREILSATTEELTGRVLSVLDTITDRAGITPDAIETLLWMGGSSLFPPLRAALEARLPTAQTVSEDLMGSVSRGLVLGGTTLS